MDSVEFDALLVEFQAVISSITEMTVFVLGKVGDLFGLVTSTPLLLIPVTLMVTGSLFGFAGRLMSVARGR